MEWCLVDPRCADLPSVNGVSLVDDYAFGPRRVLTTTPLAFDETAAGGNTSGALAVTHFWRSVQLRSSSPERQAGSG